jgi:uncharacterized membrane-anchored protein YhcB (DUF1043 family)
MELSDLTTLAKDAAFVAVGFGVIGLQRAQVRRVELTKQLEVQRQVLETQLDELRTQVAKAAQDVEGLLEPVIGELRRTLTALA